MVSEFILNLSGWIVAIFNGMTVQRLGQMFALLVIISITLIIWRMHTSKSNKVDLTELFVDPVTRKIDGSKTRMNVAFFVTSWILVYYTLANALSEWLFAAYIAAWVADRKFSRDAISAKITDIVTDEPSQVINANDQITK